MSSLFSKNKQSKIGMQLLLMVITGGSFFSLLILVAIVFFLIFLPFVGISFFNQVNKEAQNSMIAAKLNAKDPMDNKGFVQDLKKAIEYGKDWQDILVALQSKRTIYSSDKITINEAANAVQTKTVMDWLKVLPKGSDENIIKDIDTNEIERNLEHNRRIIQYNLAPYIGQKNIEQIKTIPLNGAMIEKWKYDAALGYLSFGLIGKDGKKEFYEFYGVGEAKVYSDLESISEDIKDPVLVKKYADSIVILQTTKDSLGKLGIIVNFPLDKGVKIEDKDIRSALGLLTDVEDLTRVPVIPLEQSPEEAGMATYISEKVDTAVIIPENVKVIKVYSNSKIKYGVILQSLDSERRYKFENLSKLYPECKEGKIYISNPGGAVAFGYLGRDTQGNGLLKMNTYINFRLIFKEDYAESGENTNTSESSLVKIDMGSDPAATDGFNEVDSYKAALIMRESRVTNGQQQQEINEVFPVNGTG